jgi:transposase
MVLADGKSTPLGIHVDSASPAEVKLVGKTLERLSRSKIKKMKRLIADRAYDSNGLRKELKKQGIEPVIPARKTSKCATDQDGRKLKRYRNRWKIERTIAWIQNFRRIVTRYENRADLYEGFVHLACTMITLRRLFPRAVYG